MHPTPRSLVIVIATFAIVFLLLPVASAAPGKCDAGLFDPACEAGKTIVDKASDIASAPVRYAANGAVDVITSWVSEAAQWILGRVVGFIDSSTTPGLDAAWFSERYGFMVGLASLVLLPMLLFATVRAVVSQDFSQLLRSFFVYLPVAVLGTFMAVHVTQALLAITDSLSAAVARNVAGDLSEIFDSVGSTLATPSVTPGSEIPSFAIFFGSLLLVVGSFFVWLELLIRSAAVTAAVFFLPLILSGLVWPAAMRWTRRMIEILVALILSKFVIVAVISLATAALAEPGRGGFGTVMGASALMLMSAFSPFVLLKLVPVVEGSAIDHLPGKGRAPVESMRSGGGVGQAVSVMRARTSGRSSGLAVAGPAGAATAATGAAGVAAATASGVKTAAKAPERRLNHQIDATGTSAAAARKEPPVGGGVEPPSGRTNKKDGRGDRAK